MIRSHFSQFLMLALTLQLSVSPSFSESVDAGSAKALHERLLVLDRGLRQILAGSEESRALGHCVVFIEAGLRRLASRKGRGLPEDPHFSTTIERCLRLNGLAEAPEMRILKGTFGGISGTVSAAANGLPISSAFVNVWNAEGTFVTFSLTGAAGTYSAPELLAGSYFASTRNLVGFLDEVFDDVPCAGGTSAGCQPTAGTPIVVFSGVTTSGIDFALDPGGSIEGIVTVAATGSPILQTFIDVWSATGDFVGSALSGADGTYAVTGLAAGTYFVTTGNDVFVDELYNDIPCPGGAFIGCLPTTGTPIPVQAGFVTSGIDFALATGGSISGRVTDVDTGEAAQNAVVAIFDAAGELVTSVLSAADGTYTAGGLPTGTYFAATSTGEDFFDELYDDLLCTGTGFPGCDPTSGQPITVVLGADTGGIDFALESVNIFRDGFESGNMVAWSIVVGASP